MENIFNKKYNLGKRRKLRKNSTDAERLLWSKIRNKRLLGLKFYRQYGVGNYITDFYCHTLKLVIEVDGGQHYTDSGALNDKKRENYMTSHGIRTLRFSNTDILSNVDGVLDFLYITISEINEQKTKLPPTPS